ncbi:ion channel [Rhodoferax ferrireducens]|uniref:ion channel n=1 Tax=Rhodoferax ferrireducens TaxID=192843 RepID=UPI00298E760D|nr:ion channel [Rhodoferax ferrireducens]WPC67997.1 ion channel [Rhodoferax ferrireducens]
MKKRSHALFWILSPTYKLAERNKEKLLAADDGKTQLTYGLKKYNRRYFWITLGLALAAGLFFDQSLYAHKQYKYVNYVVCVCIGWLVFFSRAFEIFKSFLDDAVEKLNQTPSSSELGYGDRLRLAFNSYIELLVGFGVLYYILPSYLFKSGETPFHFGNLVEAIYFSGVTMATVGYGDISPAHWFTQGLVVFQVFCGLTLALVSFTVYTSLALASSNPSLKGSSGGLPPDIP